MGEHVHSDETVWTICPYLRDFRECNNCFASEMMDGDLVERGCRAIAEEVINLVETSNPWRKVTA